MTHEKRIQLMADFSPKTETRRYQKDMLEDLKSTKMFISSKNYPLKKEGKQIVSYK